MLPAVAAERRFPCPSEAEMADETCSITVTDYTGHRGDDSSDVIQLPAVGLDLTIFEVKELICEQKNNPAITAANTVLYMGKNVLDEKRQLKTYNRSRRKNLALDLRDLIYFNITVKTLQQCGEGRCLMVPLWAFCCRQEFKVRVPDYETVGFLRRQVADELGDPEGHPANKIQLLYRRELMDDDLLGVREAGLEDGARVTVFVRLCFFRKERPQPAPATDGDTSNTSGAAEEPLLGPTDEGGEAAADDDMQHTAAETSVSNPDAEEVGTEEHQEDQPKQQGSTALE